MFFNYFSGSNKTSNNGLLNTTVTSVKTTTPKCAPRKFPGPAGLLSENVTNLYIFISDSQIFLK